MPASVFTENEVKQIVDGLHSRIAKLEQGSRVIAEIDAIQKQHGERLAKLEAGAPAPVPTPEPSPPPAPEPPPAPPPPAPTPGVADAILAQQRRAHYMMPFVPGSGSDSWKGHAWLMNENNRAPFELHGRTLMPRGWGDFSKRAWLESQAWPQLQAWFQCFHGGTSSRSFNEEPNAAVRMFDQVLIAWMGGSTYVELDRSNNSGWAELFRSDFGGNESTGGDIIGAGKDRSVPYTQFRPRTDGTRVVHGGVGGGKLVVPDWSAVKGILVAATAQLVAWNPQQPMNADKANLILSLGCDAMPAGAKADPDFMPANYIPGVGCSTFIRVTPQPQRFYFCTVPPDQLRANPPARV